MSTSLTHTLPIPLPESPEATGTLTNLLKALEANGLCFVHQAVIVETDNWNTYRLIDELVNPPAPEPVLIPATNGTGQAAAEDKPKRNVYTDALTGETYSSIRMNRALKNEQLNVGQRFNHVGNGQVEVAFDRDENTYFLCKVPVSVPVSES